MATETRKITLIQYLKHIDIDLSNSKALFLIITYVFIY